jgi:hypothetical protein
LETTQCAELVGMLDTTFLMWSTSLLLKAGMGADIVDFSSTKCTFLNFWSWNGVHAVFPL